MTNINSGTDKILCALTALTTYWWNSMLLRTTPVSRRLTTTTTTTSEDVRILKLVYKTTLYNATFPYILSTFESLNHYEAIGAS